MSEAIIDLLESVEVENGDPEKASVAATLVTRLCQPLQKESTVRQVGQGVAQGLVMQL